jgi:hypothetical protein
MNVCCGIRLVSQCAVSCNVVKSSTKCSGTHFSPARSTFTLLYVKGSQRRVEPNNHSPIIHQLYTLQCQKLYANIKLKCCLLNKPLLQPELSFTSSQCIAQIYVSGLTKCSPNQPSLI